MSGPKFEAIGEGLSETIGGMFDIPYQNIIENAEADMVLGGNSYETGRTDVQAPQPDDPWDPFGNW